MTEYQIRPAVPADTDAFLALAAANAARIGRREFASEWPHSSRAAIDSWVPWGWDDGRTPPPPPPLVAVDESDTIIGYVIPETFRINSFGVRDDALWPTCGVELLRRAIAAAEGHLCVHCDTRDAGARRALESAGFRIVRERFVVELDPASQ